MSIDIEKLVKHCYSENNGVKLHYVIGGKGPTIMLVHGCPDFWYGWRKVIPLLIDAGFRVVAPDMRGYNLSSRPTGCENYHVKHIMADFDALIRSIGEEKVFLVGHDMGTLMSWFFTINYPNRVRRYIPTNAFHPERLFSGFELPEFKEDFEYIFNIAEEGWAEANISGNSSLDFLYQVEPLCPISDDELAKYYKAYETIDSWTAVWDYYRAMIKYLDDYKKNYIRKTEIPILTLFGDDDTHSDYRLSDPLPELVSNARAIHYPEASHWIQLDMAQEIVSEMIKFFKED